MILEPFKTFLEAQNISPIHISFRTPLSGVILYLYPGLPSDMSDQKSDYPALQITTRYDNYSDAERIAYEIYDLLRGNHSFMDALDVIDCIPQQAPYYMGRTDDNKSEFVQNYLLDIKR